MNMNATLKVPKRLVSVFRKSKLSRRCAPWSLRPLIYQKYQIEVCVFLNIQSWVFFLSSVCSMWEQNQRWCFSVSPPCFVQTVRCGHVVDAHINNMTTSSQKPEVLDLGFFHVPLTESWSLWGCSVKTFRCIFIEFSSRNQIVLEVTQQFDEIIQTIFKDWECRYDWEGLTDAAGSWGDVKSEGNAWNDAASSWILVSCVFTSTRPLWPRRLICSRAASVYFPLFLFVHELALPLGILGKNTVETQMSLGGDGVGDETEKTAPDDSANMSTEIKLVYYFQRGKKNYET